MVLKVERHALTGVKLAGRKDNFKMTDELKIVQFLTGIGFTLIADPNVTGFLPGIAIEKDMTIRYDVSKLEMIGDLLHEAGHLAIIPSIFRNQVCGNVDASLEPLAEDYLSSVPFMTDVNGIPTEDTVIRGLLQAGEQEAQAWSYAAAIKAGVDPLKVHRKDEELHGVFVGLQLGQHAGINGMSAAGMTTRQLFPKMHRWLQV